MVLTLILATLSQAACTHDSSNALVSGDAVRAVISTDNPLEYVLDLGTGDFVRLVGEATGAVLLRLIGPTGDTLQHSYIGWQAPLPLRLSHVATSPGPHRLEVLRTPGDTSSVQFELRVDELLSPAEYATRMDSLRSDPRVQWLAENVLPLPSLSLEGDDFADLGPLRRQIGDARIVLLGEESHASGTTIRAMSRLVQFLHQEMNFDVLAFESSMFGMWQVGELLRSGHEPVDALQQGLIGTWSRSPDFEPLARYIGAQARGAHPIDVAGVDARFEPMDRERLIPGIREVSEALGVGIEGRDVEAGFWSTLCGFMAGRYLDADSLPPRQVQEDVISDLRWLAGRLSDSATVREGESARTLGFWAESSRSLAGLMVNVWSEVRGEGGVDRRRDGQMARNLLWLAREQFPGRKIIVWAHNYHVIRHPFRIDPGLDCDCLMGQLIWEALGESSFVIAATAFSGESMWRAMSYDWPDLTVATDQDVAFELEELLEATGLEHGVLPLRDLAPGGDWLGTAILSRLPNNYYSVPGVWPDHADAVLFLRTITPRRPANPT
ncbi:MAG: erythromycin esterase family protein [bacterium]